MKHAYWCLRRELWENRSFYVAPLAVAALALVGFCLHLGRLAERLRTIDTLEASRQLNAVVLPYGILASAVLFTGILVGVFYCADALNGERRDRSILFWKSMPVSDLVTVVAKAFAAVILVPLIAYAIALATQAAMLAVSSAALAAKGIDPGVQWSRLPLAEMPLAMLYGVAIHALWFAPIYAWLLLVSGWARRAPLLWAALPFFAAFVLETIAFGTSYVSSFIKYRVMGAMVEGFAPNPGHAPIVHLSQLDPGRYFSSPGFWLGLLFTAAFLAAAIRLRRSRDPL